MLPKNWSRAAGVAGTLALFIALLLFLYDNEVSRRVLVLLAAGLVGLTVWIVFAPEELQNWLTGRQAAGGTTSIILTFVLISLSVVSYDQIDEQNLTADFTCTTSFSLSASSLEVINRIEATGQRVRIVGFYPRQYLRQREAADIILRQFDAEGGDVIDVNLIDPDEEPVLARFYGYHLRQDNSPDALYVSLLDAQGQPDQSSIRPLVEVNEREISTEILKLITVSGAKFYFTIGHTELQIDSLTEYGLSRSSNALDVLGIQYEEINLLTAGEIPDDATVLAIVGPSSDFAESEVDLIRDYVHGGGRLLVLADPPYLDSKFGGVNTTILEESALGTFFWEEFGIRFTDDMVVDSGSSIENTGVNPVPLLLSQEMLFGFAPDTTIVFSFARSVEMLDEPINDQQSSYYREPLLLSSDQAYSERNLQNTVADTIFEFDAEEDEPGPLLYGIAVRSSNEINRVDGTRAVFIGDTDWVTNLLIQNQGNAQLWAAVLGWMTGTSEASLPEAVSNLCILPVSATAQERQRISILTTLIIPMTVLGTGTVVWLRRRRR